MMNNAGPHSTDIDLKLPIAPQANHRLCSALETKLPGVMIPAEALQWIRSLRKEGRKLKTIEFKGPGDPLALAVPTFATLELIKPEAEGAELSVTTLGIGAVGHAKELARLGVKKINLLVNTVHAETAAKLYSWIRPDKKTVPMGQAAEILIADQVETAKAMSEAGITVVIRTLVHPSINDNEIGEIAEIMSGLGATRMELSVAGDETSEKSLNEMQSLAAEASAFLETIITEPREDMPPPGMPRPIDEIAMPKPTKERPNVAVVSTNGMDVDLHLGEAYQMLIYGPRDDGLACLLETRMASEIRGVHRWHNLADTLEDCFTLLVTHAGDAPRKVLAEHGIKVILTEDNIEGLVDVLYGGGKKVKCNNLNN